MGHSSTTWSFNRPKAISGLATIAPGPRGPVGRLRFNRPKAISGLATSLEGYCGNLEIDVSIARRRLVVLRHRFAATPQGVAYFVSIARRRLVVLRHRARPPGARGSPSVSIARRRLVVLRPRPTSGTASSRTTVSIARRRLVVLRRRDHHAVRRRTTCFNRPKAISGLATSNVLGCNLHLLFRFNRPKAISGLATVDH